MADIPAGLGLHSNWLAFHYPHGGVDSGVSASRMTDVPTRILLGLRQAWRSGEPVFHTVWKMWKTSAPRASPALLVHSFETDGGLEFRRNTRTVWIVDPVDLIVRCPSGP